MCISQVVQVSDPCVILWSFILCEDEELVNTNLIKAGFGGFGCKEKKELKNSKTEN